MKIFIAGATGAVGMPLVRVLCALGHQVTGMTSAGAGVDMGGEHTGYAPGIVDEAGAVQDRRACCGTMNHAQYSTSDQELDAERAALAAWCRDYACRTE